MTRLGTERSAVQEPLLKYAVQTQWERLSPQQARRLREGESGLILHTIFVDQLQRLNPGFLDHVMAEDLLRRLERVPTSVAGNQEVWQHLTGRRSVFVPEEKRERNVCFIDRHDLDRNLFHVTDELTYNNGRHETRADVVFFINGVPVLLVEAKSAKRRDGISEALAQVRRYHRQAPELMALLQIYAVTHLHRFFYSATWNSSRKWVFDWKQESAGDFESLVRSFLDRERLLGLLCDSILFSRKEDDLLLKIILRPHQVRAVERTLARAKKGEHQRGLVWHTQGSGKTYTMIVAAQQILKNPGFDRPTVLMLVDRNELESQLFGNLASVGIEEFQVARSKRDLRRILSRRQRGLIVSMIHKFEGIPAGIDDRSDIFVLVDEAHRTTGGTLGNYLMGALPKATYLGFTGTPIDKTSYGKGTFLIFGKDDPPHGYLDKYSIAESIEDGTTVRLHYSLAPNNLLVDRDTLEEEFLDLADAEGVTDIESLNRVLERAVTLRNMLKNQERVVKVARHVADHYRRYVEPMGYKAFLVGVDREACALYKQALDAHLPPAYSRVVYSAGHNDRELLARYHLGEEEEKRLRKAFCNPEELPKILIVTEKLLTGFDAPILYCMYLDKPMRDHVLLQAIACVNRPYEDGQNRKKSCGFVLDFVGIFDNLEKALAFDSADLEGVVRDLEVLKAEFEKKIEEAQRDYLSLLSRRGDDKANEALLEHFLDEEVRQDFYSFYRQLVDIYEILSPDLFLRPYIDTYTALSEMYQLLRGAYDYTAVEQELLRKTAHLVQESTLSGKIRTGLEIYEIDGETLRRIEESQRSDAEKVFNLVNSLRHAARENGKANPVLISIAERAEQIAEYYKKSQTSAQLALDALKRQIEEAQKAVRDQAESDLGREVFALFWFFKKGHLKEPRKKARQLGETLERFPHWKTNAAHQRRFKQEFYKVLLASGMGVGQAKQFIERTLKLLKE